MMPNVGNFAFDIENAPRYGNTCMGAYTVVPQGFDLAAVSVTIPDASLVNTSVPVTLEVLNFGATPITSATINWTVNGVAQTPFAWTAVHRFLHLNLPPLHLAIIHLHQPVE